MILPQHPFISMEITNAFDSNERNRNRSGIAADGLHHR
jgi:hypothetical protein